MTTPDPVVDLELIAAFADGRLSPADRERAIELLASSEAALEVYVDVVRARADTADSVIPIARARRWGRPAAWWVLAPAAAAAVLLFTVLPRSGSRSGSGAASATSLIAALSGSDLRAVAGTPGWEQRSWSVTRGAGAALADSARAFRLGVRSFDLQVALSEDDRQTADRLVTEMLGGISTLQFSQVVGARYADLRRELAASQPREQLLGDASRAEAALGELLGGRPDDAFWFNFGKWSAAAEVAAAVHSRPFFQSDVTARIVSDALARAGGTRDDATDLRRASDLARASATDTDFELGRDAMRSLIKKHAE